MDDIHANPTHDIEAQIRDVSRALAHHGQLTENAAKTAKYGQMRSKRKAAPGLAVAAVLICAVVTVLNLSGLGEKPGTIVSHQEMYSRAERLCHFVVIQVERYREQHGCLPASIESIGLTAADGASLEFIGSDSYRVVVIQGTVTVTHEDKTIAR